MLPKLKLNDVVVAEDLRVYYFKDNKSEPFPMTLFSTSKDAYESLFSDPQNYFKHLVSDDHVAAQFMTDNLDLVLRRGSFPHYAEDIDKEVTIQYGVNVASCNNKKVLFIENLSCRRCRPLYDKIIKLHKVLQ